jgi:non-canonical purine NTP pyrophosphatase (RdgB/HAM1 family)
MTNLTFITGNQHKADYLAKWLSMPVAHQKLDLDEIQSTDLRQIVDHKVRQAYDQLQKPVLVEDVSLEFHGLNGLPGPFVKWFLEGLGDQKLADLAHSSGNDRATVRIMYALYDGQEVKTFDASVDGVISTTPRGNNGFGFARIFIPNGASGKTNAELTDDQAKPFNHRALAIQKLAEYLQNAKA